MDDGINAEYYWFSNDLEGFMNANIATMLGFVNSWYGFWMRNPFLKTTRMVENYSRILENYHVSLGLDEEESRKRAAKHILLMWGILRPSERAQFIVQHV